MRTFENMITEYVGNLFCPPETGHIFVVGGKTLDAASRLDIDFLASKTENDDCLLHISVMFRKDYVVRNTRMNNEWGAEEIIENVDPDAPLPPLKPGHRFKVYILVSDTRFHIAFNDINYCSYSFRGPLSRIRTIRVSKDVQFVTQVDHRRAYPSPYPLVQFFDDTWSFSSDVPRKIMAGHVMIIKAIPFGNPRGRFTISFFENETKKQALHFNARFEPYNIVVRTSTNEKLAYREEEVSGEFPFTFDQQFKLAIGFDRSQFAVAVDGVKFCTYKYRTQNQLDALYGFKVFCLDGLRLEVSSVDHIYAGSQSMSEFETFSNPDIMLY